MDAGGPCCLPRSIRRPAAPGHVARDPRRKQSGPNEIKTCCPFTGGDPRRPMPRPWTPAPGRGRPLLPAAIPGGDPGHVAPAAHAGARARSCLLPGHVAGAVIRPGGRSIRRRSWTRPRRPRPPAAIPGGLLPNCHDGPRRAPAAPAPVRDPRHAAPRPWTRGPAPRPAPSRGRYAPQDATPTGLLLPRNAQRQRATHPRTPAPLHHAPRAPARPPRPCARVAPRTRSPARVRAPAFACRYCARDFPLSRAL